MTEKIIPIFYACDDNFVKYTIVSLHSMIRNASSDYRYRVYILHTNISEEMQKRVLELANERFTISFENVTVYLDSVSDRLPIRDYYSKTPIIASLSQRCSPGTARRSTMTAIP